MTGGVRLEFPANTINEALLTATDRWRVLVEDPEASLPWSTNIEFYEAPEPRPVTETTPQMMALVRIEFDRTLVNELTGAGNAA